MSNGEHIDRRPIWELHILPMFRIIDRDHMLYHVRSTQRVDLFDYEQVKAKATAIAERVRDGNMPPTGDGGPWPKDWADVFDAWVQARCPRLQLLRGTYSARRSPPFIVLVADVEIPAGISNAWLERYSSSEKPREYTVVGEPFPDAPAGPPVTTRARFPDTPDAQIVVIDADGRHDIPID